jgi:hypothetical protein
MKTYTEPKQRLAHKILVPGGLYKILEDFGSAEAGMIFVCLSDHTDDTESYIFYYDVLVDDNEKLTFGFSYESLVNENPDLFFERLA